MARPVLAIGGVALIGVGAAIGFGWWSPASSSILDSRVGQAITSVRLDVDSSDVRIHAGDVGGTTVHQSFRYRHGTPGDAFQVTGNQLVLAGCGGGCSVDYDVVVPRGTTVSGDGNSGEIRLQGLAATNVTARSGDVTVLDSTGPVNVRADSGRIQVRLSSPQDVTAEADSGDVNVVVPRDRYRVQVTTDSGEQQVGIGDDPAGTHTLHLQADSGRVTLSPA
ncbi:DUF4097 domain-containing protein [Amycolatopsis sp. K13G38]|uniref:DUF4097 domain-containing protein n=1 Tax=Amycolatopsis acididurans TaxID=2724524 RepID=A0ABX1J7X4_9PSEU|nr:DUF4097 family beta strand repeat-containing protein [Amycolatopsis acididurans]NKQ55858.1 DUF4097 domain-containing protein [Amycolatopsis acididurans]